MRNNNVIASRRSNSIEIAMLFYFSIRDFRRYIFTQFTVYLNFKIKHNIRFFHVFEW